MMIIHFASMWESAAKWCHCCWFVLSKPSCECDLCLCSLMKIGQRWQHTSSRCNAEWLVQPLIPLVVLGPLSSLHNSPECVTNVLALLAVELTERQEFVQVCCRFVSWFTTFFHVLPVGRIHKHAWIIFIITVTRNMGQRPTWGHPAPQARLEIQFMGLIGRVKFEGPASLVAEI